MDFQEIKKKILIPALRLSIPVAIILTILIFHKTFAPIFVPFLLGFIIVYILDPLVTKIHDKKGFSRTSGTVLVFAFALFIISTFVLIIIPLVINEIIDLIANAPEYVSIIGSSLYDRFGQFWESLGPDFKEGVREFFSEENLQQMWQEQVLPYLKEKGYGEGAQALAEGIKGASSAIVGVFFYILGALFGGITGIIGFFITFGMSLVIAFYLLKDLPEMKEQMLCYMPRRYEEKFGSLLHEIDSLISGFLRGQLLVCLSVGILTGVGMFFIGIDRAILIALVAGMFNLVPYLGPVMGAAPAILFAFVEYFPEGGWQSFLIRAGAVVVWVAIVQALEGTLISPRIMGKSIRMHPLFILFALLAGGHLFGLVGMLMAIPVAAVLKIFIREVYLALYKPMDDEPTSN